MTGQLRYYQYHIEATLKVEIINSIWGYPFKFKVLTLIREFLGPSPSVNSGRKSNIIIGDVTVGT